MHVVVALQTGYAEHDTVVVCVQLVPHDVLVTLATQAPVLLQSGGGGGQAVVLQPYAVQLRMLHDSVALHYGYALQLLQTDFVQFVPQLVLTHVALHRPVLAHVGHVRVVFAVALRTV